jgi:hypothetical protein
LKSLDHDERIQGNPRKSNPHDRGFSQQNSHGPRKPKRSTAPMSRPLPGTGARQRIDKCLAKSTGVWYCFSEIETSPTCASHGRTWRLRVVARGGATRKWRRKPLKTLKTDSEIAIRRSASLGRRIDQANSV